MSPDEEIRKLYAETNNLRERLVELQDRVEWGNAKIWEHFQYTHWSCTLRTENNRIKCETICIFFERCYIIFINYLNIHQRKFCRLYRRVLRPVLQVLRVLRNPKEKKRPTLCGRSLILKLIWTNCDDAPRTTTGRIAQNVVLKTAKHTHTITASDGDGPFTVILKIYTTKDILQEDRENWWKSVLCLRPL